MIMQILDRLFTKRVIVNCDRDPFLYRWFLLRTDRLAVYLHQFVRSDEDRALHDHPWSFCTVILSGGYNEHTPKGCFRRRPLTIHYRPAEYRHRVELIDHRRSWSLIIRFRKRREWGFWTPAGFVHWNKWWQDKCE